MQDRRTSKVCLAKADIVVNMGYGNLCVLDKCGDSFTLALVIDGNSVIKEVHRNPGCSAIKTEGWQIFVIQFHSRLNAVGIPAYGRLFTGYGELTERKDEDKSVKVGQCDIHRTI